MIHLIISIPKKDGIFWRHTVFTFFRLYNSIRFLLQKLILDLQQQFNNTTLKIQTEAGFSFGNDSVIF
jgi:hypothetical protein